MKLIDAIRRRWSGALDAQQADAIVAGFLLKARSGEIEFDPILDVLAKDTVLFERWQLRFRQDFRVALNPIVRRQQIDKVRLLGVIYLNRYNDGSRTLVDQRLSEAERQFASQIRNAFTTGDALTELGEMARQKSGGRAQTETTGNHPGSEIAAEFNLRNKELKLDGAFAYLSLLLLESLTKTLFKEELLGENAFLAMDGTDLQFLMKYKALARVKLGQDAGSSSTDSRKVATEQFLSNCFQHFVQVLSEDALPHAAPSGQQGFTPFRVEQADWEQSLLLVTSAGALTDVTSQIATLLWSEFESLLRGDTPEWLSSWRQLYLTKYLTCEIASAIFFARMVGVTVVPSTDVRAIVVALSKLAFSADAVAQIDHDVIDSTRTTTYQRSLLEIQMWVTDLEADFGSGGRDVVNLASLVAGICDLDYIEPADRIALFAVVKYSILNDIISIDGTREIGRLSPVWANQYRSFLKRENQLMMNLVPIMQANLTDSTLV